MVDYREKDFNVKQLGSFYSEEKTLFRVFAPESKQVFLVINDHKYEMHQDGFIFQICLKGNLELLKYHYENDLGLTYRDPFAYYCDENDSYVLDVRKFDRTIVTPDDIDDIFIYETSVRDFSSDESFPGQYHKKFLSLAEENLKLHDYYMVGLDYIKNIGYTHIQLMPSLEFDNDNSDYNWGYNPVYYNCLEKDYIQDDKNPYAYINELRSVVNNLHRNNLRVTLDVVFNHVYDYKTFDLNKMIPNHIFRYKPDGSVAQGTFCGNEIRSEDYFVRAYLIEMVERYIKLFDIDGVRFDLMGIIDYITINKMQQRLQEVKPGFICYGEGWNMGDVLLEQYRAASINADKMPNIGFFNDFFRDNITSYVCGNLEVADNVKLALSGNNNNLKYLQSVNYVECHDNYTFFDRTITMFGTNNLQENIAMSKLALALTILARGVPFIHSGQEFLRTKKLVENSYNSGDSVNYIDWNRRVEYNAICDYTKELIEFRKNHNEFVRLDTKVSFEDFFGCLVYKLNKLKVIINPFSYEYDYHENEQFKVVFDSNGRCDYCTNSIKIPAHCLVICEIV